MTASHRRRSAFADWADGRRPGRHRAPSTSRRTAARWATAGMVAGTPLVTVSTADAAEGMPAATRNAIIACESGGHNIEHGGDPGGASTASGIYQFIDGTWRHFGGREFAPRAIAATRQQQDTVADRAYAANGLKDWEASRSCWEPKMGRHASGTEAPRHAVGAHHHNHRTIGAVHVVQRGDTLSGIAAAHELSLRTILAANAEIIDDPDRILPGQRIRI